MGADADLIRRLTEEGFLKGDPGVVSGDKEGQRQIIAMVAAAFSDMQVEFDETIDTADGRVAENWAAVDMSDLFERAGGG